MSWFSKNYEKAALGGAVAVALGLSYLGYSKLTGVDAEFSSGLTGTGNNKTAVVGADLIPKALSSLKLDRTISKAEVEGRPVDLFTGIPLFTSSREPEKAVDPMSGDPIHPPIPNGWWIENRLDPGFANSPDRDPDGDGFSNLEEFTAKTDPNNQKSVPSLIAKLTYVRDETLTWVIRPGFDAGGSFPFTYEDSKRQQNKTGVEGVAPGGLFFTKAPMLNRFKLLGAEVRKEMNKRINLEVDVTIVRVEDQRPNKKGKIYEIPAQLPEQRKSEFLQYDRTAVLSLEALGYGGKEFKVEENTAFSLPPDSSKKEYTVKKVTTDSVEVEYPDPSGTPKTVQIPKGGMPKLQP